MTYLENNKETSNEVSKEINDIMNEIINNIEKDQKTVFVEHIFKTVIQIIEATNQCTNDEKLKTYEYNRYMTILILMRTFIIRIVNLNIIDNEIKSRLYGYLGNIYTKSNYCNILKNIIHAFKQQNISVKEYITQDILNIKVILQQYIQKQYTFIGILQNKKILATINKGLLDDLFCKIIFELTIYITYFK